MPRSDTAMPGSGRAATSSSTSPGSRLVRRENWYGLVGIAHAWTRTSAEKRSRARIAAHPLYPFRPWSRMADTRTPISPSPSAGGCATFLDVLPTPLTVPLDPWLVAGLLVTGGVAVVSMRSARAEARGKGRRAAVPLSVLLLVASWVSPLQTLASHYLL